MTHAWLPFDADELGGLPAGMTADRYDGGAEPPGIERVEVYVAPYMAPERTLEVMARMPALRVVQTLTAGVDNVWPHLPAGALLCNARGVHDASTAELVVGLMIASLRRIPEFVRSQESGTWAYGRYDALADKRVLIVGYGSVGRPSSGGWPASRWRWCASPAAPARVRRRSRDSIGSTTSCRTPTWSC